LTGIVLDVLTLDGGERTSPEEDKWIPSRGVKSEQSIGDCQSCGGNRASVRNADLSRYGENIGEACKGSDGTELVFEILQPACRIDTGDGVKALLTTDQCQ